MTSATFQMKMTLLQQMPSSDIMKGCYLIHGAGASGAPNRSDKVRIRSAAKSCRTSMLLFSKTASMRKSPEISSAYSGRHTVCTTVWMRTPKATTMTCRGYGRPSATPNATRQTGQFMSRSSSSCADTLCEGG